jgi:hypothetical protein
MTRQNDWPTHIKKAATCSLLLAAYSLVLFGNFRAVKKGVVV